MKVCSNSNCTHGGARQPHTEFHRNRNTRDGLASWCKTCVRGAKDQTAGGEKAPRRRRSRSVAEPLIWLGIYRELVTCRVCGSPDGDFRPQDWGSYFLHHEDWSPSQHEPPIDEMKAILLRCDHLCDTCEQKCLENPKFGRISRIRDPKRAILARFDDTDARFLVEMGRKRGHIEWI